VQKLKELVIKKKKKNTVGKKMYSYNVNKIKI